MLDFLCLLCILKLFGKVPNTHDKLQVVIVIQYGNNYNHLKRLDLVLYLNYFTSSNPNPTHLLVH